VSTAERVARRLTAILAADVAGYSRLMAADEEGTLAQLKAHRRALIYPKIAEHCGRVVDTPGDAMLVEFASVVDALRCAVEVQRGMAERNVEVPQDRRIEFRIGIHQGDVISEAGAIFGDGVNVAARLEGLAKPGGICVSGRVQEDTCGKLDLSFEDMGEQQLKNISRPVRVYRIALNSQGGSAGNKSSGFPSRPWWVMRYPRAGMALVVVLLATSLGTAYWRLQGTEPQPSSVHRLSMVVLPFKNLSNEPEQEYFAEGITDDLTADLSRIDGSFVIAPSTARAYKDVDPKRVGQELGVRYLLDGSVRRMESMVRISARLIDTRTGAEVWSERFDGDWSKSMQLQDLITGRLARRLDLELTNEESRRAEVARPNSPDAVDLAMRGWAALNKPYSRDQLEQSRVLFERALQIDPGLPKALVGLADTLAMEVNYRWTDAPADQLRRAEDAVSRVLSSLPSDAMAHFVKGELQRARGRNVEVAVDEYEAAIAINPSLAPAYGALGGAKIRVGRSAEAFAPLQMAIKLSPRDPLLNTWYFYVCHAHSHLGQYEQAVDWCRRSIAVKPFWIAFADLAASYAWTGREEEAKAAVVELRRMRPDYTVARWLEDGNGWSENTVFLTEFERIAEGLRKAGLPD
jgi:class 3 adenylate cyclase/TolB-like protein/tetratricopeptide (TPR) repeat protein